MKHTSSFVAATKYRAMKMILESESRIRLELTGGGFEIASDSVSISPYHLLAGSLASCIALVIEPWAVRSSIPIDDVAISVQWKQAECGDHRVQHIEVSLRWPTLPDSRKTIVERLANACPIHATLLGGTRITSGVHVG